MMSKRYAEYTGKIGAVLKDGHTMFRRDIVTDLNRKSYLEKMYDNLHRLNLSLKDGDYDEEIISKIDRILEGES